MSKNGTPQRVNLRPPSFPYMRKAIEKLPWQGRAKPQIGFSTLPHRLWPAKRRIPAILVPVTEVVNTFHNKFTLPASYALAR